MMVTLFFHGASFVVQGEEIVSVNFENTNNGLSTSPRMFGTVDTNLNVNDQVYGSTVIRNMADMNIKFIRVLDATMAMWVTGSTTMWSTNAIKNYFDTVKLAYGDNNMPEFIIAIKSWPAWLYTGPTLPQELYGNYSRMCAELVKIIRIDLGIKQAVYWQPWHNIENAYTRDGGSPDPLFRLYDESVRAMKAIDPEIKAGPSFGSSTEILYRGLLSISNQVDFISYHKYLVTGVLGRTNEQIFANNPQDYKNMVAALKTSYPNLEVIMDEYALTSNTTFDERIRTNVAATFFGMMHIMFAQDQVQGANNYNVRSNFAGLMDPTNTLRVSSSVFRWSNSYFVGEIVESNCTNGNLRVLAVRSTTNNNNINNNMKAIYLVNTDSKNLTFSFSDIVGWNNSHSLVKHTINSTGVFTFESSLSLQGQRGLGPHVISPYSVWVLFYDSSNPVTVAGSVAVLSLSINNMAQVTFNASTFLASLQQATEMAEKDIRILTTEEVSSNLRVTFEISTFTDEPLRQGLKNLNTTLMASPNVFTNNGFDVIPLSLSINELIYQFPIEEQPPVPPGFTCEIINGSQFCKKNRVPYKYSTGLAGGLGALVGVGVLVAIFSTVVLIMNFQTFKKKFGNFYCAVVIFGVFVSCAAAASLLPKPTDELCLVFPWLVGIAFTTVYGCLFIKAGVLYKIWSNSMKLKRTAVTPLTVVKIVGVALFIEIVFLVIWSAVDPPKLKVVEMVNDTTQEHCHSDTPAFWIIFLCVKGLWLLFGVVISVLTRDIIKEYNDFSAIAYAIYNNVLLLAIAIPLAIVLEEVPNGTMIISVIVVVLAFTFTIIILFFDTWLHVLFPDKFKFPGMGGSSSSSSAAAHSSVARESNARSSGHTSANNSA